MATRYWEDVTVGDEVPELRKPCISQQLVLWAAGSGDFYQIHYDKDFAQSTGLPGVIVHGAFKHAFLGHLVHDWAGNTGFIKTLSCSYRGMDPVNKEIRIRGVVKSKRVEDGEHLVDLEIWTETQEGQRTTPGSAVVRLPSKG